MQINLITIPTELWPHVWDWKEANEHRILHRAIEHSGALPPGSLSKLAQSFLNSREFIDLLENQESVFIGISTYLFFGICLHPQGPGSATAPKAWLFLWLVPPTNRSHAWLCFFPLSVVRPKSSFPCKCPDGIFFSGDGGGSWPTELVR